MSLPTSCPAHDASPVSNWTDEQFDCLYPEPVRRLSIRHWTPVEVARTAAQWLVTKRDMRVLDVGCGPGKFCAIGAVSTSGIFTGVEQRERLAALGRDTIKTLGIPRAHILTANVREISFAEFDAFYVFNPFEENCLQLIKIDNDVELHPHLYTEYSLYVREQLTLTPPGTRLVTYCSDQAEIPDCFECVTDDFAGQLEMWIRRDK
jgi:SAM-dependent methyltransferase